MPLLAAPHPGEALPAWLLRFAEPIDVTPAILLLDPEDRSIIRDGGWWRRPPDALLERISRRTGISMAVVKSMTFSNWSKEPQADEIALRFARHRVRRLPKGAPRRHYGVCHPCLAEAAAPYLRKEWTLGWMAVCEKHARVLQAGCQRCRTLFTLPLVHSAYPAWAALFRCRSGCSLAAQRSAAAHPLALQLQGTLLRGRSADAVEWPGIGRLGWADGIALIDMVLALAWLGSDRKARERCFGEIERGLELTAPLEGSSYDGLLLAAWILQDFLARVRWLEQTLKTDPLEARLLRNSRLRAEPRERLVALLRGA